MGDGFSDGTRKIRNMQIKSIVGKTLRISNVIMLDGWVGVYGRIFYIGGQTVCISHLPLFNGFLCAMCMQRERLDLAAMCANNHPSTLPPAPTAPRRTTHPIHLQKLSQCEICNSETISNYNLLRMMGFTEQDINNNRHEANTRKQPIFWQKNVCFEAIKGEFLGVSATLPFYTVFVFFVRLLAEACQRAMSLAG